MNDIDFRSNTFSAIPYFYIATVCLGVLFAFVSPETQLGFMAELGIWLLQTLIPLTLIIGAHLLWQKQSWFCRLKLVFQLCISGISGILIYIPVALGIDIITQAQALPTEISQWGLELISEAEGVIPPVLLGWLALNLPWLAGYGLNRKTVNVQSSDARPRQVNADLPESEFFGVPADQVVALKSELHYLQIITTKTQFLELQNLRDAITLIESVDGVKGITPHRSWWVNLKYCQKMTGSVGRRKILLSTGLEAPVSRRRISLVRDEIDKIVKNPETL